LSDNSHYSPITSRQVAKRITKMKQHVKLYFVVCILAIMLSAWSVQSARSASSVDGGTTVESGQAVQGAGTPVDLSSSDKSTTGIPSLEVRDSILNGVNISPPIIYEGASPVNVAPQDPRSETQIGDSVVPVPAPVNPVVPVPATSLSNNSSPDIVGGSSESIISTSLKLISNWLSALLSSIFNS
jgi:hypothetical protein